MSLHNLSYLTCKTMYFTSFVSWQGKRNECLLPWYFCLWLLFLALSFTGTFILLQEFFWFPNSNCMYKDGSPKHCRFPSGIWLDEICFVPLVPNCMLKLFSKKNSKGSSSPHAPLSKVEICKAFSICSLWPLDYGVFSACLLTLFLQDSGHNVKHSPVRAFTAHNSLRAG